MLSNKKCDMVAPDDDDEYDDDYDKEGRSDDELLRKIGMLYNKCKEYESIIKRLRMELRLSKWEKLENIIIYGSVADLYTCLLFLLL
jgi:hypothetical protein